MNTACQVNSVTVKDNKLADLSIGFDTPSLGVYNNQFDEGIAKSGIFINGEIKLVDIKHCENKGTVSIARTVIENIIINDCEIRDFRAFHAEIRSLEINDSSIERFVTFNIKANDFSFNNASLNQQAVALNAVINNFDLSGLSISPDLIYEDEAYSLFHPGEVQASLKNDALQLVNEQ